MAQSNGTVTALSEKSHHQSGELESNARKMNDMQKHIAQLEHDNAAKQDSIADLNRFFILMITVALFFMLFNTVFSTFSRLEQAELRRAAAVGAADKANAAQALKAQLAKRASVNGSPIEGATPPSGRKGNVRDVVREAYEDLSGA